MDREGGKTVSKIETEQTGRDNNLDTDTDTQT